MYAIGSVHFRRAYETIINEGSFFIIDKTVIYLLFQIADVSLK